MLLPPLSQQVRALADCDSFFANCEVARNPSLKGKPVCVGGDITLAATYEAKTLGIRTGTPMREAREILGRRGIFLKPDMRHYAHTSRKVMACLREFSPRVEVASIDEAFLDITHLAERHAREFELVAAHIQQNILTYTGVPISIGIAPTRLLAKTFAPLRKPLGVFAAFELDEIVPTLNIMSLTQLPYVSHRSAARLHMCRTIGDFYRLSGHEIKQRLGRSGLKIRLELHQVHTFKGTRHLEKPKSIRRSRSFNPHFTKCKEKLRGYFIMHFEKLYAELLEKNMKCKSIAIRMRTKDFYYPHTKRNLATFTHDKQLLIQSLREMFYEIYDSQYLYRTTGITVSDFQYQEYISEDLFEPKNIGIEKNKKLTALMSHLESKYGHPVLTTATNQHIFDTKIKAPLEHLYSTVN